ncbi:MAG: hypothetical protein M9908_02920 [Phyllobacteriaceae bacterium]|nr:hypothetical protein [Phyllobacteriaceae bacterium]
MDVSVALAPQLPLWLIGLAAVPALALALYGLFNGTRGSWLRLAGWVFLLLALLNPSLLQEERENLKSVVAVVVDQSGSQALDGRPEQTAAIRERLLASLSQLDAFEIREINASEQVTRSTDVSTALFRALQSGIRDVPEDRLAGAVMITDGQVHDVPETAAELGLNAPVHAFITGTQNEKDRQIVITKAPRYGVVGESFELTYEVRQQGMPNAAVAVSVYMDGELVTVEEVLPGEPYSFIGDVPHGGKNIIELRAETHPEEISTANNRAFTVLNGIRENLRVLLVSGEPHAGERTWRNLLKSDASVDLVHFTILRPPEKQDGTPISQLSLIAFPTRELFVEKIDEFDLIIFDRYSRRGVLPVLYFDNIARYVRDGGAVLVAAGPEFGRPGSIAETPLNTVLPAQPNGLIAETPFKPLLTDTGNRHPVTRGLDNGRGVEADWSRWFRTIGTDRLTGDVIMSGAEENPLLVLQRFEEGRVALLLSDHAWLWARGFEGGGPHVQLLRRMAHWLMKEPELEEERLSAYQDGNTLIVERQTLGGMPPDAEVTAPDGSTSVLAFTEAGPGVYSAELEEPQMGLYQIRNEDLSTLVHSGPANPREFANVVSTAELLAPALRALGGSTVRVARDAADMPRIIPVRSGAAAFGNGWVGLNNTGATKLLGINRISLFAGFLGLALLLFALAAMWTREGR